MVQPHQPYFSDASAPQSSARTSVTGRSGRNPSSAGGVRPTRHPTAHGIDTDSQMREHPRPEAGDHSPDKRRRLRGPLESDSSVGRPILTISAPDSETMSVQDLRNIYEDVSAQTRVLRLWCRPMQRIASPWPNPIVSSNRTESRIM